VSSAAVLASAPGLGWVDGVGIVGHGHGEVDGAAFWRVAGQSLFLLAAGAEVPPDVEHVDVRWHEGSWVGVLRLMFAAGQAAGVEVARGGWTVIMPSDGIRIHRIG
jgi:hypothetical protein